jgi:nucleotide-binding universal stress UspA family protein
MTATPTIVAAVDLNPKAESVLQRAIKLAALCQAHLVVVHAVDYQPGMEDEDHVPAHTPEEVRASLVRAARAWLLGLVHHLDVPSVEIVVEQGHPSEVIATLADQRGARYVVAGHPRWGALTPIARLERDPRIRAVDCDVLSVGSPGQASGQPVRDRLAHWLPPGARRSAP